MALSGAHTRVYAMQTCNLASSGASRLERTVSRRPSRRNLCICRASSSASQQNVQLRLDHFGASENLNRSSLSQGSFSKDDINGRHNQEATENLQKARFLMKERQLGTAESSLLDEERHSSRFPDLSSSEEETEDDDPFEPITKINVPKQKYIPISKVSLVKALADAFNDDKKATDFLMICSLLDFILHAEHKTTLEQMRLDYKIIQSALEKEAQNAKGKTIGRHRDRKRKGGLKKLWELWYRRRNEDKLGKVVSASMREQLKKLTLDEISKLSSSNGSHSLSPNEGKLEQGDASLQTSANGTLSSKPNTVLSSTSAFASSEGTTRKSIAAAARFQSSFLKLLKNAHFQGLSTRDLQLTSALNTDYLLTLPIEVDWKHPSSEVAIIFRRGYSSERQEGLLFGAKLDYIQSLLLRKIFNWFSRPLFRGGAWINQQLKHSRESDGSKSWAEEFTEWLKEPLKPETDDDLSGVIADSLTEEEKENYLPIWIAAQQAVPRYEAFLSSVGSRGMLLRKILVWMQILPPSSANLSFNTDSDSTSFESRSRGNNLARISMRDIWLPASKVVCGNNLWRRLQAVFSIFFSRSTLQEPAYKELVLLYNAPNTVDDDTQDRVPNLLLKIYGKIPIPDLKVVFPNKKLSFRILDTVRLDIATIIGLLAFLINYRFDDFLSSPSAFLLDIIASSALIVYITRVALGYKQTYDRYQLLVNKTLYEKTLASGFGAAQFLVDASEQQQAESRESLAKKCENFIFSHFKEQLEMPIDDALANLSRLGLIIEDKSLPTTSGSSNEEEVHLFRAQWYIQSLTVLRDRWIELLGDGSVPTNFLRSLYQTTLN